MLSVEEIAFPREEHRLLKSYLVIYMYILMTICMWQQYMKKRGHGFERARGVRELGGVEGNGKQCNYIIIFKKKSMPKLFTGIWAISFIIFFPGASILQAYLSFGVSLLCSVPLLGWMSSMLCVPLSNPCGLFCHIFPIAFLGSVEVGYGILYMVWCQSQCQSTAEVTGVCHLCPWG